MGNANGFRLSGSGRSSAVDDLAPHGLRREGQQVQGQCRHRTRAAAASNLAPGEGPTGVQPNTWLSPGAVTTTASARREPTVVITTGGPCGLTSVCASYADAHVECADRPRMEAQRPRRCETVIIYERFADHAEEISVASASWIAVFYRPKTRCPPTDFGLCDL
jgi:hypothetical protein